MSIKTLIELLTDLESSHLLRRHNDAYLGRIRRELAELVAAQPALARCQQNDARYRWLRILDAEQGDAIGRFGASGDPQFLDDAADAALRAGWEDDAEQAVSEVLRAFGSEWPSVNRRRDDVARFHAELMQILGPGVFDAVETDVVDYGNRLRVSVKLGEYRQYVADDPEAEPPVLLTPASAAAALLAWRDRSRVEPGQLWRDPTGHARVQFIGNVNREGAWAVMQRCSGTARKRHRPFLYSIPAMLRGDDGWQRVNESAHPQ